MAAGDRYITAQRSILSTKQLFRKMLIEDANGRPYLNNNSTGQVPFVPIQKTIDVMTETGIPYDDTIYFPGTHQEITGKQYWQRTDKLFLNLKGIGHLNLLYNFLDDYNFRFLHLCIGNTLNMNKVNAINPGTYDIAFSAGWTVHSRGPKPNGTTAYGTTGLAPNALNGADVCMGRANGTEDGTSSVIDMGAGTWQLLCDYIGGFYVYTAVAGYLFVNNPHKGYNNHTLNRTSAGTVQGWKQNVKYTSANTADAGITDEITYNSGNTGGVKSNYSSRQLQCGWVLDGLTDAEWLMFNDIIYDYNLSLNRQIIETVVYGHSIVFGTNASPLTNGWAYLMCDAKNWTINNQGLSGRTLQNTATFNDCPFGPNLKKYIVTQGNLKPYLQGTNKYLFFDIALNDIFHHSSPDYTLANYATQMQEIITYAHDVGGYPYENMFWLGCEHIDPSAYGLSIGGCGITNAIDSTIISLYVNKTQEIAELNGCRFIDNDIGRAGTDGFHPDNPEHYDITHDKVLPAIVDVI